MVPSQGEAEDLLWMKSLSPTKALVSAEAVLIKIYINRLSDPHTFLSSLCSSLTTKNYHCCRTERAHLTSENGDPQTMREAVWPPQLLLYSWNLGWRKKSHKSQWGCTKASYREGLFVGGQEKEGKSRR